MLANIDKINNDTLMLLPLAEASTDELIRELHSRKVDLSYIDVLYNCLDDYFAGKEEQLWEDLR